MAQKVEVLPWGYFKQKQEPVKITFTVKNQDTVRRIKKALYASAAVLAGVTFAFHVDPALAASMDFTSAHDAVPVMAQQAANAGDFAARLRTATEPIREIIKAFGHEIYAIMMLWGGVEALIGKFQQGIQRMKASTIAYILLVWVPWIVDIVTATAN
jgi:hypothetical protein